MSAKEAKARIKINKLLEEAGWRFFDDASGKANIVLEPNVKLAEQALVNANRELVTRFEKKIRAPLERVGGGKNNEPRNTLIPVFRG